MAGGRLINARELGHMYRRQGPRWTTHHLTEALEKKHLRPRDFSLRELAENVVKHGREWVAGMSPRSGGGFRLLEAGTVDYSAFSNITGQIFYTQVKEAYEDEEFVFSKAIETKMSPLQDIERIPGIGQMGDKFTDPIVEGDEYPYLGVVEDYIEAGPTQKRGGIIAITKEAIIGDRTGLLLDRCQRMGFYLGLNKEKRIINTMIDGAEMAQSIHAKGSRYHWKGTSYAAYQSSSPWINVKTSNALGDWTSIQAAELILAAITDPYTGEPIMIQPTHLIVPPDLVHTANRILQSTEVRTTSPGYATSGSPQQYIGPNPVLGQYKVLSSRLLKSQVARAVTSFSYTGASTSTWFLGNPQKSLFYRANWDLVTQSMGAGSEEEFKRDVVVRHKVSEKGHPAWMEPRFMCKNTA